MNPTPKTQKKLPWPVWAALGLLLTAAIAFAVWKWQQPTRVAVNGQSYQTSVVTRGDIALSATGSGTLQPGQTVELSFPVSGTVGQLNVSVGDKVTQGQVLAVLGEAGDLDLAVQNAQLAVNSAQKTLDDLLNNGAQAIAQAYAVYAAAEKAYATAQDELHLKGDPRCNKDLTDSYQAQYFNLKSEAARWQSYLDNPNTQYGHDFILEHLTPLSRQRDLAYENWKYCEGYTDLEISQSQANLDVAKANLELTKATYDALAAAQGIDPAQVAIAQAAVTDAQLQLTLAQEDLKGATLTAPMDATVSAISAAQGETVPTGAFITLVDMTSPKLQVNVDETDVQSFKVGCTAQVTFTAYPSLTFTGEVTQVLPTLFSMFNTSSVQGAVTLKDAALASGKQLPSGLNGTVEVTCSQASDVLVVPLAAVHESGSSAYVMVYTAQNQLEKRTVEVGLKDAAYAEITNGLSQGETVVTSTLKVN